MPSRLHILLSLPVAACLSACDLPSNFQAASDGAGTGSTGAKSVGTGSILAFGDSLTSGGGKVSSPYPGQLSRMTGRPVISSGAGGETLVRGASRFPGVFDKNRPSTVVIMEGTNDAASGGSPAAAQAALASMIGYARSKGANVVVATIPPFQKGAAGANPAAVDLNNHIRAAAAGQGAALADVYSAFGGNGALTQGDGIHITNEGAGVIAATVADKL